MKQTRKNKLLYIFILFCVLFLSFYGYNFYLRKAYPAMYNDYVSDSCQKYGVPKELVFAVIRSESKFEKNACSHSGAIGLMQIMPETFSWLQDNISDVEMDENHLRDPETNIKYGTYFLSILRRKYKNEKVVLSAYNAGIGNVDKWLNDKEYSDDGETLKKIPYKETEKYVNDIIKAEKRYKVLYCKN